MLKEASGCKTWLSGYLDEASGCHRLPDPEMTNRDATGKQMISILYHTIRKIWENQVPIGYKSNYGLNNRFKA